VEKKRTMRGDERRKSDSVSIVRCVDMRMLTNELFEHSSLMLLDKSICEEKALLIGSINSVDNIYKP
jgi:hypothetical protein